MVFVISYLVHIQNSIHMYFTPLVYCLCPAGVITYSTLGIVKNLRINTIHTSHERLAQQVRAMLMPQLIVLAISGIPFGFQGVYLEITNHLVKDAFRIAVENFIGQVILIFYHFNYVFTFYIYVYKSSEIRKTLKQQVYKYMRMSQVQPLERVTDKSISLRKMNITDAV